MTVNIGIVGMGFMGKVHFDTLARIRGARVVAVCDVDPKKRRSDWSAVTGNIGARGQKQDLSGVRVYAKFEQLLEDPGVSVVDITLPTYLHAPCTIKALKSGRHVICEKPMARNSREAKKMIEAAKKAKRRLFIAHCLRFWPTCVKAREIVKSCREGRVLSATFRRSSSTPVWSWHNWLQDPAKSGLCALDMHIHDTDFILYTFGKPKAVTSHAAGFAKGRLDHIVTSYDYGPGKLIIAEGAWEYAPGFGFEMPFTIAMEKATLVCSPDQNLMLHPMKGKSKPIKVPEGDGYEHELRHFVECIAKGKASDVVSPESALESLKLVEMEVKSARTGKTVPVKL